MLSGTTRDTKPSEENKQASFVGSGAGRGTGGGRNNIVLQGTINAGKYGEPGVRAHTNVPMGKSPLSSLLEPLPAPWPHASAAEGAPAASRAPVFDMSFCNGIVCVAAGEGCKLWL